MKKTLEAGHLPRRKRPCLYVIDGGVIRVLAYFRSEEAMAEFIGLRVSYQGESDA